MWFSLPTRDSFGPAVSRLEGFPYLVRFRPARPTLVFLLQLAVLTQVQLVVSSVFQALQDKRYLSSSLPRLLLQSAVYPPTWSAGAAVFSLEVGQPSWAEEPSHTLESWALQDSAGCGCCRCAVTLITVPTRVPGSHSPRSTRIWTLQVRMQQHKRQ